ncbi:MAG: type II toxin-antitoxin system VapC family toxin [Elusimicrobia bacterium]|nr:type II toxin-antitoxin system VapC family toxin [Elusimicrobiota bacterium]
MKRVYVDTSAWFSLARKDDPDHQHLSRSFEQWQGRLVTSNFVLDEAVTLVRMRGGHAAACRLGESLRDPAFVELAPVTAEDEDEAWSWFVRHKDKAYSFTDCTSFILMRRLRIAAAISTDRHFREAGFEVLPAGA